jgi:TP901 family phage tail tape measure protein
MASSTQKAEVTVFLNGESAAAMLKELTDRTDALRRRMTDAYKAGNTAFGDMLKKQLEDASRLQKGLSTATYDYSKVLRNINGSSLHELVKAKKTLRTELQRLVPETQQYIEKSKQLHQVNAQISRINTNLREQQGGWQGISNFFKKNIGIISSYLAAFTGLQLGLKSAKEEAAKMDDAYADVMKTTGMTKDEVLQLNESFKRMDTRTGREELNMLARDAGKLGVAKKDVLGFVEAGNQINVALGEDLGDDAIKNIGKIISVFEKAQTDLQKMDLKGQMLAVGSAINTLGQSSTASEPYMVEFAQRMGGVAAQAGLSIQNVLGFASALDQSGQAVEMSATSLQKFIMKLMEDPAKFARIAGLEVKQFTQLLATDTNAAIKTVLAALGEKGGFQQLIPIFKDMKLDGARAVGTLSALATSIKAVDEAQAIANQSFTEAISLTNEYNTKNENMQARLDKARQRMKNLSEELGRKFQGPMFSAIKLWNNLLSLIVHTPKEVYILIAAIAALTVIVKSATAIKIAWVAVIKTWHNVVITGRTLALAWAAATNLLAGNTAKATQAWKLFNASFNKTVIGAAITLVAALGIAIYKLVTYVDPVTKAVRDFNKELAAEELQAKRLFDAYKKTNEGTDERRRILDEIKSRYGQYLTDLINEKGEIDNIDVALQRVNTSLREQIALKIKNATAGNLIENAIKDQQNLLEGIRKRVAAQKGENIADIVIDEIKRIYAENEGDIEKAQEATLELLEKVHGIDTREHNGFFDLSSIRLDLMYFSKAVGDLKKELDGLDKQFDGFISKKESPDELVGPPKPKNLNPVPLTYEDEITAAEVRDRKLRKIAVKKYEQDEIDEKAFKAKMDTLEEQLIKRKLAINIKYGKDTGALEDQLLSRAIKHAEDMAKMPEEEKQKKYEDDTKASEAFYRNEKKLQADRYTQGEIDREQYNDGISSLEQLLLQEKLALNIKYGKDTAAIEDQIVAYQIKCYEDVQKQLNEQAEKEKREKLAREKQLETEAAAIITELRGQNIRETMNFELEQLEELHKANLISEKAYEQKKLQIKLAAAQKYVQKAAQLTQIGADLVDAIQNAEYSRLEAEKEKELALAGDNAEKRQQIEEEYEAKKLEVQKKYADLDMAIKIAKTIAAGALAAIVAWELGPILGPIAAALVAVTTAFEIASIVQQRNAIKNMSPGGSGGSGSSASTSQRVVLPGREEGGYVDVERAQDGKRFRARRRRKRGYVDEPTVLTGEAGPEFVANDEAVANPTIRPVLDIIKIAQDNGTISTINLPALIRAAGYESGGYTGAQGTSSAAPVIASEAKQPADKILMSLLTETRDLLRGLKENGVKAPVVITEFEKKQALRTKSRNYGSRNS